MGQHYLLLASCGLLLSWSTAPNLPFQKPPPSALPPASSATRPTAEFLVAEGPVEPILITPLLTTTHGWVRQVFFEEGDYVRRRQILLKSMSNNMYSSQFNRQYTLAPRAGFVVRKHLTMGEHLPAGARIADLQHVSQVKVVVTVPPAAARSLKLCDHVAVRIAELPARRFTGVVDQLRRPTPSRPHYLLTVTVRNQVSPLIRPKMHARVLLSAQRSPAVLAKR